MRTPARWSGRVRDDAGGLVCELEGVAREDWVYGLGAGWVGSFAFSGAFRGREVAGTAYVESVEV